MKINVILNCIIGINKKVKITRCSGLLTKKIRGCASTVNVKLVIYSKYEAIIDLTPNLFFFINKSPHITESRIRSKNLLISRRLNKNN